MLKQIKLKNVGPAPEMTLDLGDRLNIITGDNGLGKSFLLDVAWWCLTRKWPQDVNSNLTSGYPARPRDVKRQVSIESEIMEHGKVEAFQSFYRPLKQSWDVIYGRRGVLDSNGDNGQSVKPGLVIYALADGSFAVRDPLRSETNVRLSDYRLDLPRCYVFSAEDIWDGHTVEIDGRKTLVCKGMIADWATWVQINGFQAELFNGILKQLSPSTAETDQLHTGPVMRISIHDGRDIPTITTSYSEPVPILYASAGIKRVLALSYVLLWAWLEHQHAAKLLGEEVTDQVTFLVDELECHLHPRWQRTILKSLLHVANTLKSDIHTQLITTTHSPLVLASAEPFFDANYDAWFDLDLVDGVVQLEKRHFIRHGDFSNWLTSEAFNLESSRSIEAEAAIKQANELLLRKEKEPRPTLQDYENADADLRKVLGELDPYWIRWSYNMEKLRAMAA